MNKRESCSLETRRARAYSRTSVRDKVRVHSRGHTDMTAEALRWYSRITSSKEFESPKTVAGREAAASLGDDVAMAPNTAGSANSFLIFLHSIIISRRHWCRCCYEEVEGCVTDEIQGLLAVSHQPATRVRPHSEGTRAQPGPSP